MSRLLLQAAFFVAGYLHRTNNSNTKEALFDKEKFNYLPYTCSYISLWRKI